MPNPPPVLPSFEHHRGGAAAEHARQRVAVAVRHLGRAVQLQHVARGVVAGQRAARLQRHAAVPADRQVERDDRVGRGERRVDVAVSGAQHQRLGRQARRKAAGRRRGVEHRRQLLGLDRDEIGGILGEIGVGREHRRDRLADIAQPLPRQQRLAIGAQRLAGRVAEIDRRQIGDVGAGPHRDDPGRRQRRRDVDARATRHGHRASARPACAADAGSEMSPTNRPRPVTQRRVLQPRHRAAEHPAGAGFASLSHPCAPRNSASAAPHRRDDALVAGAAAQIGRQRLEQLVVADIGLALQDAGGEHQEARRAEAALHAVMRDEGALQRMQLRRRLRQPLDGADRAALAPAPRTSGRRGPGRRRAARCRRRKPRARSPYACRSGRIRRGSRRAGCGAAPAAADSAGR